MLARTVIFLSFLALPAAVLQAQTAVPSVTPNTKFIPFEGRQFYLHDTGNNPGGEFARYILPKEDINNYSIKLGTLLCTNATDDPVETAKITMQTLQQNPALVFTDEILVNHQAQAAIVIFGYRFEDGDFQLNVWKYEKRIYGIFCDQVMISSPKGSTPASFKMWAASHKDQLVRELANVHWPATPNQSFMN